MATLPQVISPELGAKRDALYARLKAADRLIVAFSGGVDSSYLAYAARAALGDACLAVTAVSPSYPRSHREMAEQIVRDYRFVIERHPDMGWMCFTVELPEVYGDGETVAECAWIPRPASRTSSWIRR